MNQKNPLLNYKIKCDAKEESHIQNLTYDFTSGLWKDESGEPVIRKYINNKNLDTTGATLITETRESTDKSEGSNITVENEKDDNNLLLDSIGQTVITATREGVDRAENSSTSNEQVTSNNSFHFAGETLITRTREGADRSESSTYESPSFESLITFTRESVDRSEKS